jgi:hypothetical protein
MGKLIIDRNLANSMSINVSELLFDVDTRSFAKNIAESCALHQKYNTSITTSIYDEIKAINLIYITIQTEEINNFLLDNKFLVSSLLEAQVQIEAQFGDVPLYLELHTDFENPDWTKLFLIIKNNLPNDVAMEKLQYLLKNWFFLKDKKVKRFLTISEESQ